VLGGFPLAEEAADYEVSAAPAQSGPVAALPLPSAPDPLFDAISGAINITPNREAVPLPGPDDEPDDDPPASHEEADRELAEQEQRDLKQRGLFEGR
jgi:hypothetical protein